MEWLGSGLECTESHVLELHCQFVMVHQKVAVALVKVDMCCLLVYWYICTCLPAWVDAPVRTFMMYES